MADRYLQTVRVSGHAALGTIASLQHSAGKLVGHGSLMADRQLALDQVCCVRGPMRAIVAVLVPLIRRFGKMAFV